MMEVQCISSDIISTLPQEITGCILRFLPIKDALRTNILSRKWRYKWTSIRRLRIDENLFEGSTCDENIMKLKLMNAIFHVLLLLTSPLVEFTWHLDVIMFSEIDLVILYLSRRNTLKSFELHNLSANPYKLPNSFFSLHKLEVIEIANCEFSPPLTFNGFDMLRSLIFYAVNISGKLLKRFLTNCPLLDNLYMTGDQNDIAREDKITFSEFFECLPSIETLIISSDYYERFVTGVKPQKLPIKLVHLKHIFLGVCLTKQDELLSTLCLIKSSPNLVNIYLKLHFQPNIGMDLIDLHDYSDFKLDHLIEFEMDNFSNLAIEMEFVKLIMNKSPVLIKLRLELNDDISVDEELRMFRDLELIPFPRASPSAKFVIERPEPSSNIPKANESTCRK